MTGITYVRSSAVLARDVISAVSVFSHRVRILSQNYPMQLMGIITKSCFTTGDLVYLLGLPEYKTTVHLMVQKLNINFTLAYRDCSPEITV
jgi:hypothetical protein